MKHNKKILFLLAAVVITAGFANASSLVNLDLKKTSDSAVDMTFYTTDSTAAPMVTRKSNNKYVILMPNVSGSGAGLPSLGAVKDLVTDIDVKNVDDGISGYTKVTLTTSKPVNITTRTQKAAPLSNEEKQAKAIIAKAKSQTVPQTVGAKSVKDKTSATGNKSIQSVQDKKTNIVKNSEKNTQKKSQITAKNEVKKSQSKPSKQVKPQIQVQEKPKNIQPIPVAKVPEKQINTSDNLVQNQIKTDSATDISKKANQNNINNNYKMDYIEKVSKSAKGRSNSGFALLLLPFLVLFLVAKTLKSSVQNVGILKSSFKEHLAEQPSVITNYDDIINDSELNWQEKYKKFIEESKGEVKTRRYHFIKPINQVDKKRLELENTLEKTPEIYKNTQIQIDETPIREVQSEDYEIPESISKLKAFAKPVSLKTTQRNKTFTKPILGTQKQNNFMGKFVELKESELNSTTRRFKDGALNVSDLLKTGNKYVEDTFMEPVNENYVMSSMDEYISILDKEKELMTAPKDLSSKIAGSLSNLKPSMAFSQKSNKNTTNPIAQNRSGIPQGLIIKTGYNIDENKGFYIANVDGLNSLIGRIGDETFVLKTFDSSVNNLQVRHDSENVYVVKAGDFKALVDVSEDKMGVLIEL